MAHLQRVPPGDYLQHYLTAQGQAMLYNALMRGKTDPAKDPYDFAPWLKTPEIAARLERDADRRSADALRASALELTRG